MSKAKKRRKLTGYLVYKAQWPIATNGVPQVLIYPDETRQPWTYMTATPEVHKHLFDNRYIKVYFLGRIIGTSIDIAKFVRQSEWV